MATQLSFDLPSKTALGREDFFVSPANAAAVALIESWPDWPSRKLLLTGQESRAAGYFQKAGLAAESVGDPHLRSSIMDEIDALKKMAK